MYLKHSHIVATKGKFPLPGNYGSVPPVFEFDDEQAFDYEQEALQYCSSEQEVIPFTQAMDYIHHCIYRES